MLHSAVLGLLSPQKTEVGPGICISSQSPPPPDTDSDARCPRILRSAISPSLLEDSSVPPYYGSYLFLWIAHHSLLPAATLHQNTPASSPNSGVPPFLNQNHTDHNFQAPSITPILPAFYLRPPEALSSFIQLFTK